MSDVLLLAERALMAAGIPADEARRDAGLLARHVLGWDQAQWLSRRQEPAPAGFQAAFEALVDRRRRREPISQILAEREFFGRPFRVTRDVLTPRPETEAVVEESLVMARPRWTILDIGTGSGCVAVTLALEAPGARIIATDISEAALAIARENATRHGVLDRIDFRCGPFLAGFSEPVDLIVTNPPYVPERNRSSLAPEVAEFEPGIALFGGPDGLDVIRALLPEAARALRPGSALVMEIGAGQAVEVARLAQQAGFEVPRIRADLQGIPRIVIGHRTSNIGHRTSIG